MRHLLDVIARNTGGVKLYLHSPCGELDTFHHATQPFCLKICHNFIAKRVIAHSADHTGGETELRHMVSKVCRSAAYLATFRKHIPQRFAESDRKSVV